VARSFALPSVIQAARNCVRIERVDLGAILFVADDVIEFAAGEIAQLVGDRGIGPAAATVGAGLAAGVAAAAGVGAVAGLVAGVFAASAGCAAAPGLPPPALRPRVRAYPCWAPL